MSEQPGECCLTEAAEEPHMMKKCGPDTAASTSGCFDCNICLDFAVEPVVTLCGHLYCWPCIYKWLQSASPQQCPVCKASLSQSTLVPLYGRGRSHHSLQDIPRRPPVEPESPRRTAYNDIRQQQQHQHQFHLDRANYVVSPPASPLRTPTGTRMLHYTSGGGVLGGMAIAVLPWMFRNQEATGMHYYSSPYQMGASSGGGLSPSRVRRQEVQVERSLHQIWVFCCCCALLCLLLF